MDELTLMGSCPFRSLRENGGRSWVVYLKEIPSQLGFSTTGVRVSDAAAIELPFH